LHNLKQFNKIAAVQFIDAIRTFFLITDHHPESYQHNSA